MEVKNLRAKACIFVRLKLTELMKSFDIAPNSGPPAWKASTLPTKLTLQSS